MQQGMVKRGPSQTQTRPWSMSFGSWRRLGVTQSSQSIALPPVPRSYLSYIGPLYLACPRGPRQLPRRPGQYCSCPKGSGCSGGRLREVLRGILELLGCTLSEVSQGGRRFSTIDWNSGQHPQREQDLHATRAIAIPHDVPVYVIRSGLPPRTTPARGAYLEPAVHL